MTAALTLQVDRTSGEFQPAELRLRVRGPDGEVLTQDPVVTAIELSPPDLVTVTPIGDPTPGVLAYRCEVDTAAIGRDAELVQKGGTRSVTMTIRALPGDGYQQPLVTTCPIDIVLPGPTITWYTNGDRSTTGQPARVEAATGTEVTLHVSLERFSPSEGRFAAVDDAMFSHMVNVGPDGQTAFTYTVFGVHPAARPWEAPPGSRCEVSRWKLMTDLPPEGRPELAAPSTTFIRVRGWNAGVITARYPDRIATSEAHVAECFVPVHFVPVEATAELLEPPMPIPADGRQVELVVALRRAGSDDPAPGVPVSLSLRHHADAEGSLDPASTSATSDDQGLVHVAYTTPALTYRVGGRYLEELVVARAGDGSSDEIAVFPLHLNPELRAELHVAKDGLEFDTVRIHRPAGRTPATVTGDLSLTVENRLVRARRTSPVAHAEATLVPEGALRGAEPGSPVEGPSCRSGDNGAIGLSLEGLREGWAMADEARRREAETPLDPDREIPPGRFDAEVTLVIDQYDTRIEQSSWWLAQAGTAIDHRMATQRLTLGDQLARRPETDLPRAVSGTLLLHRATQVPRLTDARYRELWRNVGEHLGKIFDEIISMAMSFFEVADKLFGFLKEKAKLAATALKKNMGSLLASLASGLTMWIQQALAGLQGLINALTAYAPSVVKALNTLMGYLTGVLHALRDLLQQKPNSATDALQGLVSVIQQLAHGLHAVGLAMIEFARLLLTGVEQFALNAIGVVEKWFPWVAAVATEKFDQAVTAIQPLIGQARQSKWLDKSIGALVGQRVKKMISAITGLFDPPVSGRIAALLRDEMGAVFPRSGMALEILLADVDRLDVPEDPEPALARARQRFGTMDPLSDRDEHDGRLRWARQDVGLHRCILPHRQGHHRMRYEARNVDGQRQVAGCLSGVVCDPDQVDDGCRHGVERHQGALTSSPDRYRQCCGGMGHP